MTEGIRRSDGRPLKVELPPPSAEFAAAMAAPPADVDIPAPPDPAPREEAPRRRGRPPGSGRKLPAETQAKSAKGKAAEPPKDDYTADATDLVRATWTVMASIDLTCPYALAIENTGDAWVGGLAGGARKNAFIRSLVSGSGNSGWMLQLSAAAMSTALQLRQIAADKELRAEAAAATKARLREAMAANGIKPPAAPEGAAGEPGNAEQAGVPG